MLQINKIFNQNLYRLFEQQLNKLYKQMTRKLLFFGNNDLIKQATKSLRGGQTLTDDQQIRVQTIKVNENNYLIFSIPDRGLISSQAAGSNGMVFFLDPQTALYEEKEFLFEILRQKTEFDGLPIVICFEKSEHLSIKQVINYFQLFKVKQRASMIKEINLSQPETVTEIFKWLESQMSMRRTQTFDAQPKVVKMKPKYRQSDPQASQQKYNNLMKEKNFKGKNVKDQQQIYIDRQKDRIKNQNMEAQLANFNKNKKKMAPYDVKPTPNPKIQPNLNFFLKDPNNQKQNQASIKIQTDQFKEKPKQKPYVPKKTGINISTQIEQNQLFDYDKQVRPILDILVSKALQTAALEIQQEQELFKMQKYKNAYNQKVKKQKNDEEKRIKKQQSLIEHKNKLLQQYRLKDQANRNIIRKVINYSVSNQFLQGIYSKAFTNVYNKNFFRNDFDNLLKTEYLDELLNRTAVSYQALKQKQTSLANAFGADCLDKMISQHTNIVQKNYEIKKQKLKRKINKSQNQRRIHVYYSHPSAKSFSSFAKYIGKYSEGTLQEYVNSKQQQFQQLQDKVSSGDINQQQLNKAKGADNEQFSKNHSMFLLNSQEKICFAVSSNCYQKLSEKYLQPQIIALNKDLEISTETQSYLDFVNNLRQPRQLVNMDQGLVIDLKKIPESVRTLILTAKIPNANQFAGQASKKFKCASYGLEFYETNIPIHRFNVGQHIQWDQLIKVSQEQEQKTTKSNVILVSYTLTRKIDMETWFLEDVQFISKTVKDEQLESNIDEIVKFYKDSLNIFKANDDQQPPRPSSKKISSRNTKRSKSKKNIEEQQTQRKKTAAHSIMSKVLGGVTVELDKPFEQISAKVAATINQWRQFNQFCELGWQLQTKKGQKLSSVQQIKKFSKVGDIRVVKIAPVIEEVEQKKQEQPVEQNQQDT